MKEYIGAAKPLFSVGECWDSCNYNGHGLDYNQGFVALNCLTSDFSSMIVVLSNYDTGLFYR